MYLIVEITVMKVIVVIIVSHFFGTVQKDACVQTNIPPQFSICFIRFSSNCSNNNINACNQFRKMIGNLFNNFLNKFFYYVWEKDFNAIWII